MSVRGNMGNLRVLRGGVNGLGQTTHTAVTANDITAELSSRGYAVEVHHVVVEPHVPAITKSIAIKVAVDEALRQTNTTRTTTHLYRCPLSGGCAIPSATYQAIVNWCVLVANKYLDGSYALPSWAQSMMHSGTLAGISPMAGLGGFAGFSDWIQANPWFLQSVGQTITSYGEHLTAQNVQDAIKANTAQQFTKDDALALVQALQQGGYVPAGKTQTVAQGANLATGSSWTMPLLIGGGVLLLMVMMKR